MCSLGFTVASVLKLFDARSGAELSFQITFHDIHPGAAIKITVAVGNHIDDTPGADLCSRSITGSCRPRHPQSALTSLADSPVFHQMEIDKI